MPLISYKVRQGTDVLIPSGNADLHSCDGRSCREMRCFRQFQFSMGSVSFERFGLHLYLHCSLKKGGGYNMKGNLVNHAWAGGGQSVK